MKIFFTALLMFVTAVTTTCVCAAQEYDWDDVEVPVNAADGMEWQLQTISDDFSYDAKPTDKPEEFTSRWKSTFINSWQGPGFTEWNPGHSYVTNGHLGIHASRKPQTKNVYAGVVSSKETFTYPLFVETRARISDLVLASNVWLLSEDSTEEIDILEAYGSQRPSEKWYQERLHLSHHVFIRNPFQDYQPTDDGSWFQRGATNWQNDFHRVGVYWRDPWHLEYYVDGELVRTASGRDVIDPKGFTGGNGLTKPMHLIINAENQKWRTDTGIAPTDDELSDTDKSIMWVDWVRVYKAKAIEK